MQHPQFESLPPEARLYIFGASRAFVDSDQPAVARALDQFVGAWKAHGEPVSGAWNVAYDRFLLVAVDESQTALSGCSIDSLTRVVRQLESGLSLSLLDSAAVYFRNTAGIQRVSRHEFGQLVHAGQVAADTIVFDNTLSTVGALRAGGWEVPAGTSWHARAFNLAPSHEESH